jgi:hypothetical protein
MKFCTSCNQERSGDIRFCTTCGTELTNTASDPSDTDTFTIKRARPEETATDRAYSETQRVVSATPSAQFPAPPAADRAYTETRQASWDQPSGWGQSATQPPQGDQYSRPGRRYSSPGQLEQPTAIQPGYPSPGYQAGADYSQPGYPGVTYPPSPAPGPRRTGRGRTTALVAGAVVVILAAGGGAFALVSNLHHGKDGGAAGQSPTVKASTSPASTTTTAPASQAPTSAAPTPKSAPTGPVALAAGVSASPYAAPLETTFSHYFGGINAHDYAEYASSLDSAMQAANPKSTFDSGYSTTADSSETINSIAGSGSNLTAVVTFKSMQAASDSPDGSTCNNYTLTLPLVRQGSGYVIATPPTGYASWTDC